MKIYRRLIKRFLDINLSIVGLIITLPVLIIVVIAIKLESRGSVIFSQERLGFKGKAFMIYKFRSMRVGAEKQGSGVYSTKGDPRVTRVGRILRATSIDELPQLINILKGEMSFVGPRPPLTYHPWPIEEYTEDQKTMFGVRPGITGWAQINGRKAVEWNRRIELNVWYVENASFLLDVKIFFKTVVKVFNNADNVNTEKTLVENKPLDAVKEKSEV